MTSVNFMLDLERRIQENPDKVSEGISTRMKENYEIRNQTFLTRRTPVIARVDGRAFHTFTKHCRSKFHEPLRKAMALTAEETLSRIHGGKLAYHSSDEVSFLLTDFDNLRTTAYFDYNVQKMVSIISSTFTMNFNHIYSNLMHLETGELKRYTPTFDCRVFNIPESEVSNYFIDRYLDCKRNSIQAYGQTYFSGNQLFSVSCNEILKMCLDDGNDWTKLEDKWKFGTFIYREFRNEKAIHKSTDLLNDKEFIKKINDLMNPQEIL